MNNSASKMKVYLYNMISYANIFPFRTRGYTYRWIDKRGL